MRGVVLPLLFAGCGFHVGGTAGDAAPRDVARDATPETLVDMAPDQAIDMAIDAAPAELIIEAEAFTQTTMPGTPAWTMRTTIPGYSGASYMELADGTMVGAPCPSTTAPTILGCAAAMIYTVFVPTTDTYFFHLRMYAENGGRDSVYVSVDDLAAASTSTVDVMEDSTWRWAKSAQTFPLIAGSHTLHIWHRELGARVDKLAFIVSATPPP